MVMLWLERSHQGPMPRDLKGADCRRGGQIFQSGLSSQGCGSAAWCQACGLGCVLVELGDYFKKLRDAISRLLSDGSGVLGTVAE